MEIVPIEVFGISVEVPFPAPLAFGQARLEDFGGQLCDAANGLGLRPEQIRLRRTDELYNYELSAQFFGENGVLSRTADRIKFGVRNARTAADWNIIHHSLVRFYNVMDFSATTQTNLSAHVHVKFPSATERDDYLAQFGRGLEVVRPASLGYVRIRDWEKDIRVLIEQSNVVPDALFVAWDTQFAHPQEWDTFLSTLPTVMENSANAFGLGFDPFRQNS